LHEAGLSITQKYKAHPYSHLMDTQHLINLYISPLLGKECERLGIPREFILGVYSCYCKDFVVGYVEEVWKDNKLIGVRIRIGDCNQDKFSILTVFFHEMYHVKEIWEGRRSRFSELRADLYAWFRIFQLALTRTKTTKYNSKL